MNLSPDGIRKILCIKLKGIGDVVLSSIVFDSLIAYFPQAEIHYLTEKPSESLLKKLPFIKKVHLFRKKEQFGGLKTIADIRQEKYDLILDFYSNPRTALITFLSGAKYRAGFPYRGRSYAYNIFGPEERALYHAAELHLKFLEKAGIAVTSSKLYFGTDKADDDFADRFWKKTYQSGETVTGISPTGGWESKKCDPEVLYEIADAVQKRLNNRILILWGPGDEKDAEKIHSLSGGRFDLAPKCSIIEMAALIKKCRGMIANDSGPMHISSAVGTPVLGLFGPTDPRLQGPYGKKNRYFRIEDLDCIACNLLECPRQHECFRQIPVESVVLAYQQMTGSSGNV
ncbi:MAG: Lipopolysaccharide core heptosyltransferase RfaQ [Ignavibacteriaceae bacterium]|nr:Lipopolysaccharide core heptosyltransferase RfaQ [Ignavibacteriaceae bacterium]